MNKLKFGHKYFSVKSVHHYNIPKKPEALRYDLIEVTREALDLLFDAKLQKIMTKFNNNQTFVNEYDTFIELSIDLERLLSCDEHFMLGNWLSKASDVSSFGKTMDGFFDY